MNKKDLYFIVSLVLLLGAGLLVNRIEASVPVELEHSLESIPLELGDLYGREAFDVEKNYEAPSADASIYRTYAEIDGSNSVQVYVGYWEDQGAKKKVRLPRYVREGWGYYWMKERRLSSPEWGETAFNEFLNERGPRKELVYYAYIVNGRMINNEYSLRIINMWNALLHRRRNAAVVRVSSFLVGEESLEGVEKRLESFIRRFTPALMRHLEG